MTLRMTALLTISLSVAGCTTPRQSQFDAEVTRLCAADGGTRVYEAIPLPASQFRRAGIPHFFRIIEGEQALGPDYRFVETDTVIKGAPNALEGATLVRSTQNIYRRADNKLLGSAVRYVRKGGDLPLGGHPSSFACPAGEFQLIQSIFIVKE